MVDMVIAQKGENKIRICSRLVVACVFSLCVFISCVAECLFLCSKHKSVTRLGCASFWVIVVDATSCKGTCGVFVRLSSQLGWIATEFSEPLRICCSGPQPDWRSLEHNLVLFAKAGRWLYNHLEHWTRNREASNVPSNPVAGELWARGSMGNGRLSTRVGPQGFRVTRSFVPLRRFMTIKLSKKSRPSCDEFSHPASNEHRKKALRSE